jgi:hypothetical protein
MMSNYGLGGKAAAGGCSNALDYTQACNSQYLEMAGIP